MSENVPSWLIGDQKDWFQRFLDEKYDELSSSPTLARGLKPNPDHTPKVVSKTVAHLPVSIEMQLDLGWITEDEAREMGYSLPEPYKPTWRERLSNKYRLFRLRFGIRIGSWVAGEELDSEWGEEPWL